jgi:hypothetical protein
MASATSLPGQLRRLAGRTARAAGLRPSRPVARAKPAVTGPQSPKPAPAPPLPPAAAAFDGIIAESLNLAGIQVGPVRDAVNVVLPPFAPEAIFAGVSTALKFARGLALELDRPLRVIQLSANAQPEPLRVAIEAHLAADGVGVPELTVLPQPLLAHTTVGAEDVWITTYWTTAHAADVACRIGVLDPSRVIYLIQDYEPGFHAWSVPYALTRATYHAGFHHVVNSRPLARYLAEREGEAADHGLVIAPHLDLDRLAAVARARRREDTVRVFFYARPNKPRNLYQLGVAALRHASTRIAAEGLAWDVVSGGELHPQLPLPGGGEVRGLGTLSWDGYFDLLGRIDVGLSLMYSPHPSHPPLELAVSGALAVTNELDGVRSGLHPRVNAVSADVLALSDGLVEAVRRARDEGPGPFEAPAPGSLGDPLEDVIGNLAKRLRSA